MIGRSWAKRCPRLLLDEPVAISSRQAKEQVRLLAPAVLVLMVATLACGKAPTPGQTATLRPSETPTPGQTATPRPTETPTPEQTATPRPTETPTPVRPPAEANTGDAWTRPADGMVMVYAPAGEFLMGSDDDDVDEAMQLCAELAYDCGREWFEAEQPAHAVALGSFWIDQTEVTNAHYRDCVEAGDCEPPHDRRSYTRDEYYGTRAYDDYPVIKVSWQQARTYCEWAGARLPTEAEWEYAARGPGGFVYPWGDSPPGEALANCCGYVGDTTRAGSYPAGASWCGALDMAGNVWEWVADWYRSYPSERQVNPAGPAYGEWRVLRGGPWGYGQYLARCAFRRTYGGVHWGENVGFRCAVAPH